MRARVLEEQADLFEMGVLSQTADLQEVAAGQLLAEPSGPPVVMVGGLLSVERLADMRRLSSALSRTGTPLVVVPPFADLDLGRYFETPVQLRMQRRSAESSARIVDSASAAVLGDEVKVRSDHYFETALGAGVIALDQQGKPVLIRYQASNTSGPVFFSSLQLLSYTALTDEEQRQRVLSHLLSWAPALVSERTSAASPHVAAKASTVEDGILISIALLLAAGGLQPEDQLRMRGQALLGTQLSPDDVDGALQELGRRGLVETEGAEQAMRAALSDFLEQRGLHPYVRELSDLLAAEEPHT